MRCTSSLSAACMLLVGCVATGPDYKHMLPEINGMPDGMARLVFFRTDESSLYSARSARVLVNGERVGGCALGGFFYRDLLPGEHHLVADMWDAPGHCEVIIGAQAGATYYFQIDARPESFWAFVGPAAGSDLVSQNIIISVAAGIGGITAEAYGRDCGGAFRLYPVDPATAQQRMSNLKLSE